MSVEAAIVIAPYDDGWPAMFEAERKQLERVLGPWLVAGIEHVGSTAVAGMAAKPVIDIMAPVDSLAASRPAIEALRALHYQYAPYRAESMHWFCKPGPEFRTHHLHLVPYRSAPWDERIRFRDCLRSDPVIAADYVVMKRRLAALHVHDREAYTEGKGAFIADALRRAARR